MPLLEEFLGLKASVIPWPLPEKSSINESSCRKGKSGAINQCLPIKSVQCSASRHYPAKLTLDARRFRERWSMGWLLLHPPRAKVPARHHTASPHITTLWEPLTGPFRLSFILTSPVLPRQIHCSFGPPS